MMELGPQPLISIVALIVCVIVGLAWLAISIRSCMKQQLCPICKSNLSHTIWRREDRVVVRICLNPSCSYSLVVRQFE